MTAAVHLNSRGLPYCGARLGERMTDHVHHVTCPECVRKLREGPDA